MNVNEIIKQMILEEKIKLMSEMVMEFNGVHVLASEIYLF